MVQFVKAIVEESSLKGFDVLWADARERMITTVLYFLIIRTSRPLIIGHEVRYTT